MKDIVVIVDNFRSVHNVGSVFRTSECVGVSKIYLCGTTPTPVDRFGRARADVAKVALGAEAMVPWEYVDTTKAAIERYRSEGYFIAALEQDDQSVSFRDPIASDKIALILGYEVSGITKDVLDMCDVILEIPQQGTKESLNVSVATGIALFELGKD